MGTFSERQPDGRLSNAKAREVIAKALQVAPISSSGFTSARMAAYFPATSS